MSHTLFPEPDLKQLESNVEKVQQALDDTSLKLVHYLRWAMRDELAGLRRRKDRDGRVTERAAELCEDWHSLSAADRAERMENGPTYMEKLIHASYLGARALMEAEEKTLDVKLKARH